MTKTASLARIAAAYMVALAVAAAWLFWGADTRWLWLDTLIADVLATVVVFAASRMHHNSSFYDAYWSVVPPVMLVFWWSQGGLGVDDVRSWLVLAVVLLWAIRLTANWILTFPGMHHEDWRYAMLRERAGRRELWVDLVAIHLVPTVQVFLGMLPVYVVVTRGGRQVGWLDVLALLVGLGAVAVELVADVQLHRFVRDRRDGEVMDQGLWGWSRHPNYFGEVCFWTSLALFSVAASPGDAWWLFVGVAAMVIMFQAASIPMMEQRNLERRPGYQDVVDRVPRLVPRPRRQTTRGRAEA